MVILRPWPSETRIMVSTDTCGCATAGALLGGKATRSRRPAPGHGQAAGARALDLGGSTDAAGEDGIAVPAPAPQSTATAIYDPAKGERRRPHRRRDGRRDYCPSRSTRASCGAHHAVLGARSGRPRGSRGGHRGFQCRRFRESIHAHAHAAGQGRAAPRRVSVLRCWRSTRAAAIARQLMDSRAAARTGLDRSSTCRSRAWQVSRKTRAPKQIKRSGDRVVFVPKTKDSVARIPLIALLIVTESCPSRLPLYERGPASAESRSRR